MPVSDHQGQAGIHRTLRVSILFLYTSGSLLSSLLLRTSGSCLRIHRQRCPRSHPKCFSDQNRLVHMALRPCRSDHRLKIFPDPGIAQNDIRQILRFRGDDKKPFSQRSQILQHFLDAVIKGGQIEAFPFICLPVIGYRAVCILRTHLIKTAEGLKQGRPDKPFQLLPVFSADPELLQRHDDGIHDPVLRLYQRPVQVKKQILIGRQRLQQETHRPESVVAGDQSRLPVFHPSLIDILSPVGEGHDEGRDRFPGTVTKPLRFLPPVRDKYLPLPKIAGMLDRVLIPGHQVLVTGLSQNRDPDISHPFSSGVSQCIRRAMFNTGRLFFRSL